MTRHIDVQFPRSLLLENVVAADIHTVDPLQFQRVAVGIDRHIRARGAEPRGPLVQLTRTASERSELMRQATVPLPGGEGLRSLPLVEVRSCVLARFRDDVRNLNIVYSKLAVFAYENEISLSGEFYLVFVSERDTELAVDVFAATETV